MLLADVWVIEWQNQPPPMKRGWISWADGVWLLVWPFLLLIPRGGGLADRLTLTPLIFVMYLAMFHSRWVRRLMRVQILTVIGGMCYSIYLMHNLAIGAFGAWWGHAMPESFASATILSLLTMLPLSLLVSALYFRLIERPCMRRDWPKRLYRWFVSHLFVEEQSYNNHVV